MKSTRIYWWAGLFVVFVLVAIVAWGHSRTKRDLAPFEHGRSADVAWEEGGKPMEIVCSIKDTNNRPLTNVSLNFVNNSGGNRATTDATGTARIRAGEPEFERILVNEVLVMHRPRAYGLNYPNVQSGLTVRIVVKDRRALGIQ